MSFDAILGQDAAIGLLKEALVKERVASAYLFYGPDGVGKRTAAMAFARAVLCSDRRIAAACGECPACRRSRAGSHPGLIVLERRAKKTMIVIDQVHELAASLALRPMEGDSTVVVIDEVERTNVEVHNALLKTLEEPPPGTTIVLVTPNRDALPATIRSRCQPVRFRPLPRAIVTDILSSRGDIDPELLPDLTERAAGSPGRALRLLELGFPESGRAIHRAVASSAETDPVDLADALFAATGEAGDLRGRVREILLMLVDEIRARYLDGGAETRDPERASAALGPLTEALERIDLNVDPRITLRSVVIRIRPILR
ncbi:MAG: DNA polymerase III subunit delta' [Planctomycetota bacterium]